LSKHIPFKIKMIFHTMRK